MRGSESTAITDSIVNQILSEMDGIENSSGVFVIGATNRAELLDPAILRPGRFDYQIEIPLPNADARKQIFDINLRKKPVEKGIIIPNLVTDTEGFSGAEIAEVCREAAWNAIRDYKYNADKVVLCEKHLRDAIIRVKHTKEKLKTEDSFYIR
jgi:transitional endoplasmic reticulum ATPase